jgi:hypothetical protein
MSDDRPLFDRLLSAQERIGVISKDQTNPFYEHKYADINTIIDMVKPILNDEGLLLLQPLSNIDGKPAIKTIIMCKDGEISDTIVLPEDQNPQKMGSAITYFRRYALQSMLFMQAEDDDGNAAAPQNAPKKDKPKEQSKAQSQQARSEIEIPTCSICHQPMKPQANNPNKFYCKHAGENGKVKWGDPVHSTQKKAV